VTQPPQIQRNSHPIKLDGTHATNLYFGGSFDPPHLGHASLPAQAAHALEQQLDLPADSCRLIYVPAARSPHKDIAPTADHHRLAMLNLALKDLANPWTIWEQELQDAPLNTGEPSYWADTWAIANQLQPNANNRFLIGADQALSMHRWHRYSEYWKSAVVMMRDDASDIDTLIQSLDKLNIWTPEELAHWRTSYLTLSMVPWSSTSIRNQLASNRQIASRQKNTRIEGLDPGVQSYIFEHGLYH